MENISRRIAFFLLLTFLSSLVGCGGLVDSNDNDGTDATDITHRLDAEGVMAPSETRENTIDVKESPPNKVEGDNLPLNSREIADLTDVWSHALKNRDGKARYEIMSESMRKVWNNNTIGDPDFLVCKSNGLAYVDSSDIVHYLLDEFGNKYIIEEHLTFASEKGQPVVTGCHTGNITWEREYKFTSSAEAAYYAMINAIFDEDYYGMLSLAHKEQYGEAQKENLLKKVSSGIAISKQDIRESKAMFQISCGPLDAKTGNENLWLLFEKDDRGWFSDYIFYETPPDEAWWNAEANWPVVIEYSYDPGKIVTDEEFVLPNGVELEMTYEEVAEQLNGYEDGFQHSPGTRIIVDRGIQYVFYLKNGNYTLSKININSTNALYKPSETGTIRDIKIGDSARDVFLKIPAQNTTLQRWAAQKLYGSDKAGTKNSAVLRYEHTYTVFITSVKYMMQLNFDKDDRIREIDITIKE